MEIKKRTKLIYSCSGCSNVAQLANHIAVKIHQENLAKMSCIAGIGGDVKSLVNEAKSGQEILVLDGCPLSCALNCLKRHDIEVEKHLVLTELGLKKDTDRYFDEDEKDEHYNTVTKLLDLSSQKKEDK